MIKLTNIINELQVNTPGLFWDMVKGVIFLNEYYAESLLNNHYSTFEDYINEYGIEEEEEITKYKTYYDYFSKITPNEIKSKIYLTIYSKYTEIHERITYKFIETWFNDNKDVVLIMHNNKIFLSNN